MATRNLLYYQRTDGIIPFERWFEGISDVVTAAIVLRTISKLARGNHGNVKTVGEGVFEARIDHGPGYWIYFGQKGQRLVIILCGGDKGSQGRDIDTAKDYWRDYKRRAKE